MERDWNVQDGSDCDLNALPLVRTWPSLAPHAEAVERLVLMGAIEDDDIGDGASCHVGYRSCFYRSVPMGPIENIRK